MPEYLVSGTVIITQEEYRKLVSIAAKVDVFKDYVNNEKYSISREMCGLLLGFTVVNNDAD